MSGVVAMPVGVRSCVPLNLLFVIFFFPSIFTSHGLSVYWRSLGIDRRENRHMLL